MKEPLVSIVVINFNGGEIIENCLHTLIRNTAYKNYKLTVVDNGSTDDSVEKIKKFNVPFIVLKRNLGFPKGMNTGVFHAIKEKPDYIVYFSNDVIIPENQKQWLGKLVADLEADRTAAVAGMKCFRPDGSIEETGTYFVPRWQGSVKKSVEDENKKQYVDMTSGACIVIRRTVADRIGLYDEKQSPFWYEDTDLFVRIKKAGYKVIYDPAVAIKHIGSYTINKLKNSRSTKIIEYKNFIRFAYKHYPFYLFVLALANILLSQIARDPISLPKLLASIDLRAEKTRVTQEEFNQRVKEFISNRQKPSS
ncbi:MAG: glycosyltransferase family 2 protein [Candidatus Woesearchaeota archaeon]